MLSRNSAFGASLREGRQRPVPPILRPGRKFGNMPREEIDGLDAGVPGEHESRASADEGVEAPASRAQCFEQAVRRWKKYGIGLDRESEADTGKALDRRSEPGGAAVRMFCIAKPGAALEQADPRGGEESHLRRELAGLLAAIVEIGRER